MHTVTFISCIGHSASIDESVYKDDSHAKDEFYYNENNDYSWDCTFGTDEGGSIWLTEHIIAFYNNNIPSLKLQLPIAYLFGINTTTDSMNSLLGPTLSQVFPSELYPNVTNPSIGMAHLTGINTMPNEMMGVKSYVVKSLVIFSNARNDNFILDDSRILRRLSSTSWPDHYTFAPLLRDANALYMFNDWKVRSRQGDLDPILPSS